MCNPDALPMKREEKKREKRLAAHSTIPIFSALNILVPRQNDCGAMLWSQYYNSFIAGMNWGFTSNSSPGMSQCWGLDFTSWTFLTCAVLFFLFVCLWLKFILLPVLCRHGVRDESIYRFMQRNTRDECLRKLTAAVNNHVLNGGWSNPSLRVFFLKVL